MSNIILTHACNKGCSYCFAKEIRDSHTRAELPSSINMTLEMLGSIIDKHLTNQQNNQPPMIKLLGGEPTLHPQFENILSMCYERKIGITLVSNFLFSKEKRDIILKFLKTRAISFLVNSTELDQKDRMDVFKENYNTIYKYLYERNAESNVSCGITLDPDTPIEEYVKYIDFLKSNLVAIENMRVSLAFPGGSDKKGNFFFLKNTKVGDSLVFITKKLMDENIPANLDCINFPCMYETKEEAKFVRKFLHGSEKHVCGLGPGPTDYMPDGSAIYCYPNANVSVDTTKFKSDAAIQEALRMKYQIARSTISLPKECQGCKYLGGNECEGPCVGFFSYDKDI
jgi:organic radical activating enzyme